MTDNNSEKTLAAVMFVDIVGYTAMLQDNEDYAAEMRSKFRNVVDSSVTARGGKVVQYYGDGALTLFPGATSSALCAEEIQRAFSEEPKVPARIGLHLGDVAVDKSGAFGDAVNVASRLERLSCAGGVLISGDLYSQIKNNPRIQAVEIGDYRLKNVKLPVSIYALSGKGLVVPSSSEVDEKAGRSKKSLAVLPFVNMSSDPENEYFSDGITEEILNALAKTDGLLVTARTSSFAFKGQNLDVREIGEKLGVSAVLEGSVRKFGSQVRITAQLIDTQKGFHVFSETYDRELTDIFALQDEVAEAVVKKLTGELVKDGIATRSAREKIDNFEAYNNFLKGKFYWNKWSIPAFRKALKYFKKAADLQPDYASAHSWISASYLVLATAWGDAPDSYIPNAYRHVSLAEKIDPELPDVHITRAFLSLFVEWDWPSAYVRFQVAMRLRPDDSTLLQSYSYYLIVMGKTAEAVEACEKAYKVDPMSAEIALGLATAYIMNRQLDEAIDLLERILEIDPHYLMAYVRLAMARILRGEYDEAWQLQKRAGEILETEVPVKTLMMKAYVLSAAGKFDEVEPYLKELIELNEKGEKFTNHSLAVIYSFKGDLDKAFDYLEGSVNERDVDVLFVKAYPGWDTIREHPRYEQLLRRLNLLD